MKVIHYENLPTRMPLFQSIVLWLLLDRLNAPAWGFAIVGTVMALVWIGSIIKLVKQVEVKVV